ncbi:hypothetical protein [Nioella nitratireducens]|uniref:hypothetical protein n=1 Tax=Nioella nitratireducens TaxID=1287720 RepID=UPI0008FD7B2C|nr:hypothetical protein [Nioella nitratireducens]
MAVSWEILRSYRAPREVMRRLMAATERDPRPEARGFIYLMVGCLIIYLSQVPDLVMQGTGAEGEAPMDARLAITFFAWIFVWPLLFFALAGISHLVARALGGAGQGINARLALFWSVLAVSPLFLLRALAGLAGNAQAQMAMSVIVAVAFVAIWSLSLIEAERPEGAAP